MFVIKGTQLLQTELHLHMKSVKDSSASEYFVSEIIFVYFQHLVNFQL